MRVLRVALAGLMLAAFATAAQASHIFWVDKNTEGFENPPTLGDVPDGWTLAHTSETVVTDDEQVFEGSQSALIPAGGASGITRQDTFHDSGEYHWMFYDDMAEEKNTRVGLDRTATFPNSAPRFAAIGVETGGLPNHSATHYVWHHSFSFGPTTVPRSEGWRHMHLAWDVVEGNTVVEYYIDGVLGHVEPFAGIFIPTAEWIGAPFGTASPAWVDAIPEPSSLALLALGLVAAFGVRRRR